MEIEDMFAYPENHPPSPYGMPLVSRDRVRGTPSLLELPRGVRLIAIGWIGKKVPSMGIVPSDVVDRLFEAFERNRCFDDSTGGWHDCEVCPTDGQHSSEADGPVVRWQGREFRLYGHGHHLVRNGNIVYMCPRLVLHYILDHAYRPPDEFLNAVQDGVFLTLNDLVPIEGWSYDDSPGVHGFVPTGAPPRWEYSTRLGRGGYLGNLRPGT